MKKHRLLTGLLAFLLAWTLLPTEVLAAQFASEVYYEEEWIEDVEEDQSELQLVAAGNSSVTLKSGNYARWIDRINVPDNILDFYAQLEEATDNDGIDDWLIDISTATQKTWNNMPYTVNGVSIKARGTYSVIPVYCTESNKEYIKDCMWAARDAFIRDHPEVFWLSSSTGGLITSGSGDNITLYYYFTREVEGYPSLTYDIRREGYTTASAIKARIQTVDSAANAIIDAAGSTDYEKIRYFNNWLTTHNEYNTLASEDRDLSPYRCDTALTGNTGEKGPVCTGYSHAFKVLCDRVGIPCVLVDSNSHMWNYVQLGSAWYAVDVTWDDPVVKGKTGAVSGSENEKYLLVGSDTVVGSQTFLQSHPVQNAVSSTRVWFTNGPVLSKTAYTAADSWAQADVEAGIAAGIVPANLQNGYTQPSSRANFCALVVGLYESATGKTVTGRTTFTDTSDANVEKAAYLGVVEGVGNGLFNPQGTLTREQAATMLARLAKALGQPLTASHSTFSDNSAISNWALEAVGQVQGAGIMDGVGNNTFAPRSTFSWQQSIVTIMRMYRLVK